MNRSGRRHRTARSSDRECPMRLAELPRAANGRPDLSGVWQALNMAHWNLEPHVSAYPVVIELGAQFAVPPGKGVVEGGAIPYCPRRARSATTFRESLDRRPRRQVLHRRRAALDVHAVSVPDSPERARRRHVYQFARLPPHLRRRQEEAPLDSWMGWSNGRWDGDTFVVDVTGLKASVARPRRQLRERQRENHGALPAARSESLAVRSDDRRLDRVLTTMDDSHAALSPRRCGPALPRVQMRAVRGKEDLWAFA